MRLIRKITLGACLILAMSTTAFAYLDPSVMTYVIQAGAGIVIAIGAVAGILWRKARKKVNKVLNIDENANKEVEDDLVVLDDADENGEENKNS